MAKPHILVVDDERSIRLMLETGLALEGFDVTCARTGREALDAAGPQTFDAVISDIYMPDGDGLAVVRGFRAADQKIPIILITAQGSLEMAVQAVAEGASDFVAKPFEMASIVAVLRRYLKSSREGAADKPPLDENLLGEISSSRIVGRSAAMVNVYKLIAHAARSDITVLVLGESGTGKELVARAIHDYGNRAKKPFLSVNCSGLTDTLLEAQLFGYRKGAFTGATSDRVGLFEASDGGTLFLDELGSTSPAFQASLLRVLEAGEVRPVGSTEVRHADVRVVGASNHPLRELIASGQFRADLYYRLSVLTIDLPPLRERYGDVELLSAHFLRRFSENQSTPLRLSPEAREVLRNYLFPGNVRELENALRRAAVLSSDGLITPDCLPPEIAAEARPDQMTDPAEAIYRIVADRPAMSELQRRYLQFILNEVGGNRRRAAAVLGLDRRTVQRLIARHHIEAADENGDEPGEAEELSDLKPQPQEDD